MGEMEKKTRKTIKIRLTKEEKKTINRVAKHANVTPTQVINVLLAIYMIDNAN